MAFDHPICTQVVDIIKPNDAASAAATANAPATFTAVSDPTLRRVLDLRGYSGGRMIAMLGGTVATATKIRVQYHVGQDPNVASSDPGWTTLADSGGSQTANRAFITPVITLPAAALIENLVLRIGIFDGDGTASPTIRVCTFNLYRNVSLAFVNMILFMQTIQNMQGLRKDMRANANGYITVVTADASKVPEVATIMNQDAAAYLVRLGWQTNLLDGGANQTLVNDCLSGFGTSLSELQAKIAELQTAANNLAAASKTTVAQITTAANAVLSQVTAGVTVF